MQIYEVSHTRVRITRAPFPRSPVTFLPCFATPFTYELNYYAPYGNRVKPLRYRLSSAAPANLFSAPDCSPDCLLPTTCFPLPVTRYPLPITRARSITAKFVLFLLSRFFRFYTAWSTIRPYPPFLSLSLSFLFSISRRRKGQNSHPLFSTRTVTRRITPFALSLISINRSVNGNHLNISSSSAVMSRARVQAVQSSTAS